MRWVDFYHARSTTHFGEIDCSLVCLWEVKQDAQSRA